MKKAFKIIIAIVLVLALSIIGFLYYNKIQEDRMGPVSFESFKRIESDGKVFMENKDIGLKFMVPEGWVMSGTLIKTPDFESLDGFSFLPKIGCAINIGREDDAGQYEYYKKIIDEGANLSQINNGDEEFEVIQISKLKAVKEILLINKNTDNQGSYIDLAIPNNNIIYHFEVYALGQDKEKCLQEFNNFLKTINLI